MQNGQYSAGKSKIVLRMDSENDNIEIDFDTEKTGRNMPDIVTIYDIASVAHVSPATVSKALNGRKDVSTATRNHVLETASKMGYRPICMPEGSS